MNLSDVSRWEQKVVEIRNRARAYRSQEESWKLWVSGWDHELVGVRMGVVACGDHNESKS